MITKVLLDMYAINHIKIPHFTIYQIIISINCTNNHLTVHPTLVKTTVFVLCLNLTHHEKHLLQFHPCWGRFKGSLSWEMVLLQYSKVLTFTPPWNFTGTSRKVPAPRYLQSGLHSKTRQYIIKQASSTTRTY